MSNYEPEVNDYVIWTNELGQIHEGWVYFKGDKVDNEIRKKHGWNECQRYITIEIGTKPKPKCEYSKGADLNHKLIHSLLLCYESEWCNLQFVCQDSSNMIYSDSTTFPPQNHGQIIELS